MAIDEYIGIGIFPPKDFNQLPRLDNGTENSNNTN